MEGQQKRRDENPQVNEQECSQKTRKKRDKHRKGNSLLLVAVLVWASVSAVTLIASGLFLWFSYLKLWNVGWFHYAIIAGTFTIIASIHLIFSGIFYGKSRKCTTEINASNLEKGSITTMNTTEQIVPIIISLVSHNAPNPLNEEDSYQVLCEVERTLREGSDIKCDDSAERDVALANFNATKEYINFAINRIEQRKAEMRKKR